MANSLQTLIPAEWAALIWQQHWHRLEGWFRAAIRGMGMPVEHFDGLCPKNDGPIGRPPSPAAAKRLLASDVDLFLEIVDRVERAYWQSVAQRRMPPHQPAGWLYRVMIRTTRRVATARARVLLRTLQPVVGGDDSVDIISDTGPLPDETLERREVEIRLEEELRTLADDERALLREWSNGVPFGLLAADRRTSPGALRIRVHRLVRRLRKGVVGDDR